jgi:hypothetical protein
MGTQNFANFLIDPSGARSKKFKTFWQLWLLELFLYAQFSKSGFWNKISFLFLTEHGNSKLQFCIFLFDHLMTQNFNYFRKKVCSLTF